MNKDRDGQRFFGTKLVRVRDTPVRVAFATLVGSHRFWVGYAIGLPVVTLLAAFAHRIFVPIAAGVPVGICLLLLWLSHEFIHPQLLVDFENRTLTKSRPYGRGTYSSMAIDDIGYVSVVQLGHTALVNFHYRKRELSKPYATVIDATDVPAFETRLKRLGVRVHVREPVPIQMPIDAVRARVIATPMVIVATPTRRIATRRGLRRRATVSDELLIRRPVQPSKRAQPAR